MTLPEEPYGEKRLCEKLKTKWAGRVLSFYEEIDSTNVRAKQEAEDGAEHGTVVVADHQTAGRGRCGRTWNSPSAKNLYFTLILRPSILVEQASMLTLVMAIAVAKGMEKTVTAAATMGGESEMPTRCQIKWPNDIVVNGRKICGILTELSIVEQQIDYVLVGVGINVKKQEFSAELVDKASTLEEACGFVIDRSDLLANVLAEFEEMYVSFTQSGNLKFLRKAYDEMLVNRGREVCVLDPKGEFRGMALGISDTGELLVKRENGSVEAVYAGEVSVRGIYGYV